MHFYNYKKFKLEIRIQLIVIFSINQYMKVTKLKKLTRLSIKLIIKILFNEL
jgi:hypothetical protein